MRNQSPFINSNGILTFSDEAEGLWFPSCLHGRHDSAHLHHFTPLAQSTVGAVVFIIVLILCLTLIGTLSFKMFCTVEELKVATETIN